MPAYVIVEVDISDPEKYNAYKELTPATVQAFGGKFVLRGNPVTVLEGEWNHERLVMLKFPTREKAIAWYNCPEYQHAKSVRAGAADAKFLLIET
ncbi:DUF1330 domain-containing protein [Algoriphagus halophytocola]|uniref:DUF1330 domain-containing protein n=1 Tax=Algoriphagus halophytocola TaxID=2991499 RepID=A0ABY6MJ18_9BACT|nr:MULTISPECIES: DUF1330 domain-containing protein [unclassified Algoriphagus]UZD23158.1 DUF1330 domain-containing protein [Algoriphagus sp. TR-M5]WBL44450.1 DUF1330 domain-containing protein [Algoriphagus sp. TR-M9]